MPDYLEATTVAARFTQTGTDTACVNCEDADPANDLTLTLGPFGAGGVNGFGYAGGSVSMTGFLESIRDAALTIEYDLRIVSYYGAGSFPEELAAYPLPSVSYGTVSGFILGEDAFGGEMLGDFAEDCCNGIIYGASFMSAFGPTVWNAMSHLSLNGEVHWVGMPYTPEVTEVPEPATLVLIGSGLLGAGWKRKRRAHNGLLIKPAHIRN